MCTAAVLVENLKISAHEISMTSFLPPFGLQSPETEDDTGRRRQKRALHPSLLEGLNREEECGEEREMLKKTALLEACSWNAPRSYGGKRGDAGS